MALIVQKYGGTSVGSVERIKNVAQRVAKFKMLGHQIVVVVSAMSGETDRLVKLARAMRLMDKGSRVWLIYPDREIGLEKVGGAGERYSNGIAVLDINGNEATLSDGPKVDYKACQAVNPKKK